MDACQAEDAAAAVLAHAVDAPPLWPSDARNAIVFRQRFIEERVVGVENLRDGPVALEEILEEQDRFLVDRLAQGRREGREQLLVLLFERVEIADRSEEHTSELQSPYVISS